jgi:hypothetical protein
MWKDDSVRTLASCSARYNAKAMLPYLTGKEAECAEYITDVKKRRSSPYNNEPAALLRERHYRHTKHIKIKHALRNSASRTGLYGRL